MKHQEFIDRLKSDPKLAINVVNMDTVKNIVCKATAATLIRDYGSIEEFYDQLGDQGVKRIKVSLRRINGTSSFAVNDSAGNPESYDFNIEPESANPEPASQNRSRQKATNQVPDFGLNGFTQLQEFSTGLNAAQQGMYYALDYGRLKTEYERQALELAQIKADNQRLEREAVEDRIRKSSGEGTKNFITDLMPHLPQLVTALSGFVKKTAVNEFAPGLGNPQLSMTKQQLVSLIGQLDEDSAIFLIDVINAMSNEKFLEELDVLMKKINAAA